MVIIPTRKISSEKPATPAATPAIPTAPTTPATPVSPLIPTTPSAPAKSTPTPVIATPPAEKPAPTDPLLAQVDEAIKVTSRRYLDASGHTPWQMVHGLLALRENFEIKVEGKKVNGLEWISNGPVYRGTPWFEKTQYGGRAQPYNGTPYVFEGHPNQFIGYMTLCNLPLEHKFKTTGEETITVADIINNAKMEVREGDDNTWTLWALAHYLGPDARWVNKYNQEWSVERLVQLETYAVVTRAPCGGCHGLFALAYARNGYIQSNKGPLRGVWLEADMKVKRYVAEAKAWQNSDGSFSANSFKGPGYSPDFEKRVNTSGHILEFLMGALTQKQIEEEWIRRAVQAISRDLIENRKAALSDVGGMYHAVDSLVIYRDRIAPKAVVKVDDQAGPKSADAATAEKKKGDSAIPAEKPATTPMPEQRSTAKPVPVDPNEPAPFKEDAASALPLVEPAETTGND